MISPEELAEMRSRLDAATPGPWKQENEFVVCDSGGYVIAKAESTPALDGRSLRERRRAQAEFISASRTDMGSLLDEVERLRAALDKEANTTLLMDGKRADLEADVTRLRATLEWYASRTIYERLNQFKGDDQYVECADMAREALEKK